MPTLRATMDPVTARGGTVVELLGDAFVAWFPGQTATAAVGAAAAMQRSIAALEPVTVGIARRSFRLKIGVPAAIRTSEFGPVYVLGPRDPAHPAPQAPAPDLAVAAVSGLDALAAIPAPIRPAAAAGPRAARRRGRLLPGAAVPPGAIRLHVRTDAGAAVLTDWFTV